MRSGRSCPARHWDRRCARPGPHLDTTILLLDEVFSLSFPQRRRGWGRGGPYIAHPNPLPTRSLRGEGENFCWLCHAPHVRRPVKGCFSFLPSVESMRLG